MTTTIDHGVFGGRLHGRHRHPDAVDPTLEVAMATRTRSTSASLWSLGIVTLAISAWGGIIPFVGPTFGYNADGVGAWHWSLTHAVLALIPGALGCLIAMTFFAPLSRVAVAIRRVSMTTLGLVAIACGAWFIVGPTAWPILDHTRTYFVSTGADRNLANYIGYSFGPGVILATCGAFAMGWAARHNQPLEPLELETVDMVPSTISAP